MARTALRYSATLIAIYLGVAYFTGSGKLIDSSTAGATGLIKAFQGR